MATFSSNIDPKNVGQIGCKTSILMTSNIDHTNQYDTSSKKCTPKVSNSAYLRVLNKVKCVFVIVNWIFMLFCPDLLVSLRQFVARE